MHEQGQKENNRTVFLTLKIVPKNVEKKYIDVLYDEMLKKIKTIRCNKILTEVYEHPNYSDIQKYLINNLIAIKNKL